MPKRGKYRNIMKTYILKLSDEERLVLKDEISSLVRVGQMMQRKVFGNDELKNTLERADQVLLDILKKINNL